MATTSWMPRAGSTPAPPLFASISAQRGRPADPWWVRPALIAILLLAAGLLLWELPKTGWGNAYYANAVHAASHSWSAFWTGALDPSGTVSIDKTPLSIWMMALSARVFGFTPGALLVPNALCMLGAVGLVYALGRRAFGAGVGLLAALFLAVTPATVAVGRFDNPDALLVLLLLAGAWWAQRAAESGRLRHALLCGASVGLAFNTKMLQAYLVLPALAAMFLIVRGPRRRPRWQLLVAGGGAVLLLSGCWLIAMSLLPASSRPWVGDTTNDSWWQLVFAANGLGRLAGAAGTASGGTGPLRLVSGTAGTQIAWLLPLAGVGAALGIAEFRRYTSSLVRANLILWTTWAVVHLVVFSFVLGLFHPYYTSALAPALAVLAAYAVGCLLRAGRGSVTLLVGGLGALATAGLSIALLERTPGFLPWLPWALGSAGVLTAGWALRAARIERGGARRAVGAGLIACAVAGPFAYSLATTERRLGGIDPLAGPGTAEEPLWVSDDSPDRAALIRLLIADQGRARYLAAVSGSIAGAPIALLSGRAIVTMGGFAGTDPAPSPAALGRLVGSGEVRSVLLTPRPRAGSGTSAGLSGAAARERWVVRHCVRRAISPVLPGPSGPLRVRVYRCGRAGG